MKTPKWRAGTTFPQPYPNHRPEPATEIRDAGHFLQEDKGEEIAGHILAFLERRPVLS